MRDSRRRNCVCGPGLGHGSAGVPVERQRTGELTGVDRGVGVIGQGGKTKATTRRAAEQFADRTTQALLTNQSVEQAVATEQFAEQGFADRGAGLAQ